MELTDKQLTELVRIVRENQNVNDRWLALSKDPINNELQFTKDDFLTKYGSRSRSIEGRIREYTQESSKINLKALRNALDERNDAGANYSNSESSTNSTNVGVSIAVLSLFLLFGYWLIKENQTDSITEISQPDIGSVVDRCIERSRYESSCRANPEFTYCSIAFENQIGSGCTSRIRAVGGQVEQGEFCIEQLRPIINRQCLIENFGCAAVTGSVSC